ncbi:MAG: hypothetical protein HY698_14545 [Deltaproteobacteria bacterium]|nr:hypothetical protein [Deltaproteobacteria bacterium]
MVRALSIVLLTLFIGQATGLTELVEADECAQPCPGDSPDGHCPPACQFCACCPTLRPAVLSQSAAILPSQESHAVIGEQTETPPSPEPREILHVPKLSLA